MAYFSPENVPVTYHLRKLCEKLTRYPFQSSPQFTDELLKGCVSWLTANVCHILPGFGEDGLVDFDEKAMPSSGGNASNERYTLDNILDIAHRAVARRGVRIFVIDPATHPLPKQGSVCIQLSTGVQYEKSIDWRNHQCCWINASGEPILQAFLDRFNVHR